MQVGNALKVICHTNQQRPAKYFTMSRKSKSTIVKTAAHTQPVSVPVKCKQGNNDYIKMFRLYALRTFVDWF